MDIFKARRFGDRELKVKASRRRPSKDRIIPLYYDFKIGNGREDVLREHLSIQSPADFSQM